ncbi:MAG TPA: RDD family protein [Anaerolineales bacterium]|nr:RDD family protein [Anaerolineales bacterium]
MTLSEETLDIQTPENVAFGYQVAGIGSRFIASLLDTLLIGLLQIAIVVVMTLIISTFGQSALAERLSAWVIAIFGVILAIFYWGYYVFFEMLWNGQSPGKRWVGLRVIRTDGTPITLSEALIRNLVRIVDFLPAGYGVGIITMFIDKQSRRLGDLAAGTLVVQDRAPISIQSLSVKRAVNLKAQGLTNVSLDGFPIERLTNDDLNLIEDFLLRRDQLTHRDQLAIQILNTLHRRFGLPQPTVSRLEAEDTLAAILLAVQSREKE